MKFIFSTKYSEDEIRFINKHKCEILTEINLSRVSISKTEIPKHMIKYGGEYIAEILDDECNELVWAVLSKWKGCYHFTSCYKSLEDMEQGL